MVSRKRYSFANLFETRPTITRGKPNSKRIAFQSVATRFLADIKDDSITEDILRSIVRMCQYMHSSVTEASDVYSKVRIRSYFSFINYVTETFVRCAILFEDLKQSSINPV